MLLRDSWGIVFSGSSPSAQLLEEETAEDVTPLRHGAANSFQDQKSAIHKRHKLIDTCGVRM